MVEPGTTRIAERTPLHVFHLDLIAAIYPDARFVHIVRDGRDVARSIAAQEWGPQSIEEAGADWRSAILAARGAGLPEGVYREVRYEDLLREPAAIVSDLYEWLGLPATDDIVAEAVSEAGIGANLGDAPSGISVAKWREAYSEADLATFDRVAGDVLREFGYPAPGKAGAPELPASRGPGAIARARGRLSSLRRPRVGRSAVRARPLQELVDGVVGSLRITRSIGYRHRQRLGARRGRVRAPDDPLRLRYGWAPKADPPPGARPAPRPPDRPARAEPPGPLARSALG